MNVSSNNVMHSCNQSNRAEATMNVSSNNVMHSCNQSNRAEATMNSMRVVYELSITGNCAKILSVEQQCFNNKFTSSATEQLMRIVY
jgi:hypothetical protein